MRTSRLTSRQRPLFTFREAQARRVIRAAVASSKNPVFPCAFIAGDVVLLHLLATEGLLANDRVPVVAIDTFHLFDETHDFCRRLEQAYDFTARVFRPDGFNTKAEFVAVHGSDLFLRDTAEYDRIAKVEPFQRAMRELNVDLMINGRRRDHGGERAFLEVAEAGNPVNVQPLAFWEFADCMRYIEDKNLEAHPLHAQGYPSIGDVHSTLPVPRDKWFEYGGERSGRFQNLTNADGSPKTECGIHNRPK